jgi:NADPH:quinone reductase-like Zn-dependent oxidoreductase
VRAKERGRPRPLARRRPRRRRTAQARRLRTNRRARRPSGRIETGRRLRANLRRSPETDVLSIIGTARVVSGVARGTNDGLAFLKRLIEAGQLRTVIEKRYSLHEIADAHRRAEGGHKKGHVVVLLR